jgi:hypothetical protein
MSAIAQYAQCQTYVELGTEDSGLDTLDLLGVGLETTLRDGHGRDGIVSVGVIRLSVRLAGHLHSTVSGVGREGADGPVDRDIGEVDTDSRDPAMSASD